jgi:hypothetical protein
VAGAGQVHLASPVLGEGLAAGKVEAWDEETVYPAQDAGAVDRRAVVDPHDVLLHTAGTVRERSEHSSHAADLVAALASILASVVVPSLESWLVLMTAQRSLE